MTTRERIPELNYTVVGFEYPTKEAAGEVFERAYASLTEVSLWRVATPELDRWFLIGLLSDTGSGDDGFDWGDGIDYSPPPEQLRWMVMRRLGKGFEAVLSGLPELRERLRYDAATAPHIPAGG